MKIAQITACMLAASCPALATLRSGGKSAGETLREGKQVTGQTLADCAKDDFLAEGFTFELLDANSTYSGDYEGCYEVSDSNDVSDVYTMGGNLTAGGGTFYASDNGGSLPEAIWYFAEFEEGVSSVGSSFLCYDLDFNSAADTHVADVTSWGVAPNFETTSVTTTCEIMLTCGCTEDDDDEAMEDDDDAAEAANGALGGVRGARYSGLLAAVSSAFMVILTASRA